MNISAFGVVHKSQLSDDTYAPITSLGSEQRKKHKAEIAQRRKLRTQYGITYTGSRSLPEQLFAQVPRDFKPDNKPVQSRVVAPFKEGVKRRLGYTPKISTEQHGMPGVLASVSPTRQGVKMNYNSRAPIQSAYGAKHTGVHESAHYATDSQVRRGKTRSPFRLSQISADAGKLAREEGRADGTADRYYPGVKPNAYQRGEFFQTAEDQAEYDKIRAKVAGGKKPKTVTPKAKIAKPLKIAAAIR